MNLNDIKQMEKLDAGLVAESISLLPGQIRDAWKQAEKFKIAPADKKIDRIVLAGMGGSNLAARIIISLFKKSLQVPLVIEAGYDVPGFVDKNTLLIISSYSGGTEEPLSTYAEAEKRGARIIGLSARGEKNKLAALLAKEKKPCYLFDADKNPSRQPRLALGYAVSCLLVIFHKLGVIKLNPKGIDRSASFLEALTRKFNPKNPLLFNPAKKMAEDIFNRQIVLAGGEFLEGNLHAWRNQFCENSKNFAAYLVLPDMNHYAIEGLRDPKSNGKNLVFVFLESNLYHPRVKKRLALTEAIVKKNGIKTCRYKLSGKDELIQSFETLSFGSWVTFYLSMLNNVNPSLIPWVDWFKEKLR